MSLTAVELELLTMITQSRNLLLPILLLVAVLAAPSPAFAFQKLKIGNGALLKKMFGGRDDRDDKPKDREPEREREPEKKAPWYDFEAARKNRSEPRQPLAAPGRESFEQTRKRLEDDARRMQDELRQKLAAPFQRPPASAQRNAADALTGRPTPVDPPTGPRSMASVLDGTNRKPEPLVRSGMQRSVGPQNQPRISAQTRRPTEQPDPIPTQGTTLDSVGGGDPGFGVAGKSLGKRGIQVTQVQPGSAAESIGIRPGDVLENVAGLELSSVEEIDAITNVLQPEDQFEVAFRRDGKPETRMLSGNQIPEKAGRRANPPPISQTPLRGEGQTARSLAGNSSNQTEIVRLQQQIESQQRTIRELRAKLQQQASIAPLPSPENTAPAALDDELSLELNLEPPR